MARLLCLLMALLCWLPAGPARAEEALRVAVLPFATPDGAPDLAQYGEGTMDALIAALKAVPKFVVVDRGRIDRVLREQAFGLSGLVDPATAVKTGELLEAQLVVRGSITRNSPLTLQATVTDLRTGGEKPLPPQRGDSLFDLQDQVALALLKEQRVQLTPEQQARMAKIFKSTADLRAYDAYLKGRKAYLEFTEPGFAEAAKWYREAIQADAGYALAHAAMAETFALWGISKQRNGEDGSAEFRQALAAAQEALRLNPDLPEAHRAHGEALHYLHQPGFEAEARQALALAPNEAETWYALWVASGNSKDPDHAYILKALELNPDLVGGRNDRATALLDMKRFDQAAQQYRRAIKINPAYAPAHMGLGAALGRLERHEEAVVAIKEALRLRPRYARGYQNLGGAYLFLKRYEESEAAFREAIRIAPRRAEPWYFLGLLYTVRQRWKEAVQVLEEALKLQADYLEAAQLLQEVRAKLGAK